MSRKTDPNNGPATANAAPADLGFDPDALKAKYRAERDKRLRKDGTAQYLHATGDLAHFLDNPYVESGFTRAALTDEVEVLIVGGGFCGLMAGARLRQAGVERIRIVEKAGDFGGTWYWNRYPGIACDIESYIYMPLLEETGYIPRQKYAPGAEILAHCHRIAETFDLYRDTCFQTEITDMRWDEERARWVVHTDRGDAIKAQFVVTGNGPFSSPKLPGIPGLKDFKGHSFHTSRWDYGYTGGDANGGLTGLKDKRVGIIGTGATAVQCIPHLAESAAQLYVFQRTPPSIDVRGHRPTDPEWVKTLEPGWQQKRMDNFLTIMSGGFQEEDLVNDSWSSTMMVLVSDVIRKNPDAKHDLPALMQLADFQKMEQIRARVDAVVQDKATSEAMKPYYNLNCKRPCFHDSYLNAFNRPNVTLVDTDGKGVDRITGHGAVVAGKEYEIDCLIFATGFEIGVNQAFRSDYEIYGRGGISLTDKWKDGVATLHGLLTRDFPNCFIMSGAQAAVTINFPHTVNEQTRHIAYIVKQCRERKAQTVEPTQEAEDAWVEKVIAKADVRAEYFEECTPSYRNSEGKVDDIRSLRVIRNAPYGGGPLAFIKILEDWRAEGAQKGLEFKSSDARGDYENNRSRQDTGLTTR